MKNVDFFAGRSRLNKSHPPLSDQNPMLPLIRTATFLSLLAVTGCVIPGYPYNGMVPPGAIPGGQPYAGATVLPNTYAPQQIIVAPTFYSGWGYGYWYGNQFWPYRNNCGFWNGNYYGGYRWNNAPYGWNRGWGGWRGYGYGGWH